MEKIARNKNVQHLTFDDGSKYIGEIEDGMKSGVGLLFIPDGSVYLGQWLNDIYHGDGIYIYPDGERYEGELDHG